MESMNLDNIPENVFTYILNQLLALGPKKLNMDALAEGLSMSKRTLYEMFGSKRDMVISMIVHHGETIKREIRSVASDLGINTMLKLAKIMLIHRNYIMRVSSDFFVQMDEYFPEFASFQKDNARKFRDGILDFVRNGVDEGVFRDDVDYGALLILVYVQYESLKRMENIFPEEITFKEAFNTISLAFLRAIATPKGMESLNQISGEFRSGNLIKKG